jgi:hypothetical protein
MHLPHPHTTSWSNSCKIYHRNFTSSKRDRMITNLRYQSSESMLLRALWWSENNDDILEKWRKKTCHVEPPLPEVDGVAYLLIGKEASQDGELEWGKMVARYLAVRRNGVCGLCESEGGAQISPADFLRTEPSSLYLLLAWAWHHGSPKHMHRGLLVRNSQFRRSTVTGCSRPLLRSMTCKYFFDHGQSNEQVVAHLSMF